MIPKKLHFIWIGDDSKRPVKCIDTWITKNPDYGVHIWDNSSVTGEFWYNAKQLHEMLEKKDYAGASDIMRYEILARQGGIYIDADSYCIRPLEDWLLECNAFACWEQEHVRNNLVANGFIGSVPEAEIWDLCMDEIRRRDCTEDKLAWQITGPLMLSEIYFSKQPDMTIYPSHFFMPEHHTGHKSKATGHRFASHMWGSDMGYDNMDAEMEKRK